MKAIVCTKYGPPEVLQLVHIEKPIPKEGEILIKIRATTVHIGDTKIRSFKPGMGIIRDFFFKPLMRIMLGFRKPRVGILGMELSGDVEEIGKNVTKFKVGDPVFAATGMSFGTYAEYKCIPEKGIIAIKPNNISYEEAAAIPNGAVTALLLLRKASIKKGHKILIYGASGSIGTFAIQLAIFFGAEVTAVCSTSNLKLVLELGAKEVIDYTKEDFTNSSKKYDLVLDAVGKIPSNKRKLCLAKNGFFLNVLTATDSIKLKVEDLQFLTSIIEKGQLTAVIDRQYKLEQIVEAHHYVEQGHKKGNVIVQVK